MAKITVQQQAIVQQLQEAKAKKDSFSWNMAIGNLQRYFTQVTEHLETCPTERREKIHLYAKTPQQSGS